MCLLVIYISSLDKCCFVQIPYLLCNEVIYFFVLDPLVAIDFS